MAAEDEDLWAPFLAFRREDKDAARLRRHVEEDLKRGGHHPPRRAASLSRDQIVATAIAVADAEGPEAISMRRIARELNAGTMSLYWHVVSKEELLDLMIDAIVAEGELPEPTGDWREDLRTVARVTRATLSRHQWSVTFMAGRPPTGPGALRNLERSLAMLDGLGLDQRTTVTILLTIGVYVRGWLLQEFQERNVERAQAGYFGAVTEDDQRAVMAEFIDRVRATGRYPHLVSMMEAGVDPDSADTRQWRFEFGLESLIDGFAARIASQPPKA